MQQTPTKPSFKRVGSYPSFNVIFSITVALFMIGFFCLLAMYASRLTERLRNDIEIKVFLKNDLTQTEKDSLKTVLAGKYYIDKADNRTRIGYKSKDAIAKEMIAETGKDFVAFLGENPLRDAFIVYLNREAALDQGKLSLIKADIQQINGVYEAVIPERHLEEIDANVRNVGVVIFAIVGVLFVTVSILINNAIKLALFSQRFLIRSMQLVGATDWFIKKPFLRRAFWQGVLSGVAADVLLALGLVFLTGQFTELALLHDYLTIGLIFVLLLLIGGLTGALSAYVAVSRYLRMKLDELY